MVLSALLLALAGGGAPAWRPLNVLVVLADQHSARALGCYGNGFGGAGPSMTPNLDELAQQGVRFENAVCAAPQCSPSRYSLLTGRWPHMHGLRWNQVWEPRDAVTFPELARAAGYATASIGKHHMAWMDQPPGQGDDHGFGAVVDIGDYNAWCAQSGVPTWSSAAARVLVPGLPSKIAVTGYTTNANAFHPAGFWADEVLRFLDDRAGPQGDGRPFVCWYSMYGPHTPILPSAGGPLDWSAQYDPADLDVPPNVDQPPETLRLANLQASFAGMTDDQHRAVLAAYYGLVAQIDWNVGRVLRRLETLGLADRTLVVYVADHGEMAAEMGTWTKGGGGYDAVVRVPMIARLPGVLPAGAVVTEPVNGVDLLPTLLEVTGVPIDPADRARVDGRSILDLATAGDPGWRDHTFSEFGLDALANVQRQVLVRKARSVYLVDELGGEEEYYDLATDPWQTTNRVDDPLVQAEVAEMRWRLIQWWNGEVGHAPPYAVSGDPKSPPSPAQAPVPAAGAAGVARDVDPAWVPSTAADTQTVWLGTDPAALAPFAVLGHVESSFNPGTLAAGTTWWWRVDGANANGSTAGPVWTFTTAATGPGGPGLAASPSPAHGAPAVAAGTGLAWTPAPGALTQDLWLGPPGALQPVASGLPPGAATYDPGPLPGGVAFAWRVDATDAAGTTVGDVWTFTTTTAGLPGRAAPLFPRHLATGVPVATGAPLAWSPAPGATSYAVRFGTAPPLPTVATQTGTTWDPGPLAAGQTFYWRVDAENAAGTTTGWTWRFATDG